MKLDNRIVVFIGPEGSGKSTMASKLANEVNKPYITTGDIIRNLASNDPGPLGTECRDMFASHTYLNAQSLLKILANRFSQSDVKSGFILDGGLRTLEETENLPKILDEAKLLLPLTVVYLNIPREVSLQRLVNGRKRSDDTIEAVNTRLDKFYYQLDSRLNFIKSQINWNILEVNATVPIENVYKQICNFLTNDQTHN